MYNFPAMFFSCRYVWLGKRPAYLLVALEYNVYSVRAVYALIAANCNNCRRFALGISVEDDIDIAAAFDKHRLVEGATIVYCNRCCLSNVEA